MFEWEFLGPLEYKIVRGNSSSKWRTTIAYVRYDRGSKCVRVYFEMSIRQEELEPLTQVVRQVSSMMSKYLSEQKHGQISTNDVEGIDSHGSL